MNESKITLLENIELLAQSPDLSQLKDLLAEIHPADLAELLDELDPDLAVTVFAVLPDVTASEVLDETGSLVRRELVERVEDERLADLLEEMPMDDAVGILEDLPADTAERLLALMEPEEAEAAQKLLSYADESAGRLMTTEVAALRRQWTAAEALDYLRRLVEDDLTEMVHYLYVVDRDNRLIGVVPIRKLLMARAEETVESLMNREVISVRTMADQEELAELVSRYDFVAVPVVDNDFHLVGVVTVDDVLDVLEEEATEDIQRLGGSEPLARPYFDASVWEVIGKRLVWLLPLFAASLVSDAILRRFDTLLASVIILTLFIPVISGTGGNSGSQTVATIIRALAIGEVRWSDLRRTWMREAIVGTVLGLVLGIGGFVRALIWGADTTVALVLALTLPLVVIWANTVATLVPMLAEKVGIDPAVVSAPMITTIVDASGVLIYLSIASYLLLR